jgi:hypothetical protein
MMMEGFQATAAEPSVAADQEFHPVAGLVEKSLIATRFDETQAQYRLPAGILSPAHDRSLQVLNRLQSGIKAVG